MKFILLTISLNFFIKAYGQDSAKGLLIKFADTCYKLQREASFEKISGINHALPLWIANGVIISHDEINIDIIDSITVIKCPESFEKFGNLAANGVISISTKQEFEAIKLIDIAKEKRSLANNSEIIYALNGYFFTDTLLQVSKKAVVKVEIVKQPRVDYLDTYKNVTCISIWTITEKELEQDKLVPRPSRLH